MKPEVVIVDYGMGNVGSILNMLDRLGHRGELAATPEAVLAAPKLILPGVGSFDYAMERLATNGLDLAVLDAAKSGVPLLGICLGMQLLMEFSEEGSQAGLGLVMGSCRRFGSGQGFENQRVPHMGWNEVKRIAESRFIPSLGKDDRYYFVHSYRVIPANPRDVLGVTTYGNEYCSAIERDNVLGVQFHPEKSHRFGGRLLSEFVRSE